MTKLKRWVNFQETAGYLVHNGLPSDHCSRQPQWLNHCARQPNRNYGWNKSKLLDRLTYTLDVYTFLFVKIASRVTWRQLEKWKTKFIWASTFKNKLDSSEMTAILLAHRTVRDDPPVESSNNEKFGQQIWSICTPSKLGSLFVERQTGRTAAGSTSWSVENRQETEELF